MEKLTLHDIFDMLEIADKTSAELSKYQYRFFAQVEKAVSDNKTAEKIKSSAAMSVIEAQYVGFKQGLRLARALFCEDD